MTDRPLPEQTFFADPAVDRVLGMVMTLAGEVWVLRDRVRALEAQLAASGALKPGALDRPAGEAEAAAAARDRAAFVHHLMENLMGEQVSRGAAPDLLSRFPDSPRGGHD